LAVEVGQVVDVADIRAKADGVLRKKGKDFAGIHRLCVCPADVIVCYSESRSVNRALSSTHRFFPAQKTKSGHYRAADGVNEVLS